MERTSKKKLIGQGAFLLFLIVATVIIVRQNRAMPYQHNKGMIFGTTYSIVYQYDRDLQAGILDQLQQVDNSLSPFNETSIISRVNRNETVEVNDLFTDVFTMAQEVSADTHGAFDITVAPLVNTWGFGFKQGTPPTKAVIDSLLAIVGYEKVKLSGRHVVKQDARTMLDCSAIAKGYGCDVVARYLRDQGVTNYMIEIGGEIVAHGVNDKQTAWRIGVTKPTDDSLNINQELQTIINVADRAMATSGNYRNFYYKNGRKYAHTIDPATGYPVQHSILSATVLTNSCARADAYATESGSADMHEEEKRKVRIAAGGLQSVWRLRTLLNPLRYGTFCFQYISHRVLRWSLTPVLLFSLLPLNTILIFTTDSPLFYAVIWLLQTLFYLMASWGYYLSKKRIKNKILFVPYYFLFMNINVVRGFNYLRKRRGQTNGAWEKAQRA